MILITCFEPEFSLNLYLGSLLIFHGQKCPILSTSLPFSPWDMWSTSIRKNQPAIVPQLPVPAFCEGPPWPLVRFNLCDFWVTPWLRVQWLICWGIHEITSKSALHVDINTDGSFYLCACVGCGYILSVQVSLSWYFHCLVVTGDRRTNYFLLLWWYKCGSTSLSAELLSIDNSAACTCISSYWCDLLLLYALCLSHLIFNIWQHQGIW